MKPAAMHRFQLIPAGMRIQDMLPAFAAVVHETGPIGTPCPVCPSCRKPFHDTRPRKFGMRIYPADFVVPVALHYDLCLSCGNAHRRGGAEREGVLTSIQAFIDDEAPTQ